MKIKMAIMWIISAPIIILCTIIAWPVAVGMFVLRRDDSTLDYFFLAAMTTLSAELMWLFLLISVADHFGI